MVNILAVVSSTVLFLAPVIVLVAVMITASTRFVVSTIPVISMTSTIPFILPATLVPPLATLWICVPILFQPSLLLLSLELHLVLLSLSGLFSLLPLFLSELLPSSLIPQQHWVVYLDITFLASRSFAPDAHLLCHSGFLLRSNP